MKLTLANKLNIVHIIHIVVVIIIMLAINLFISHKTTEIKLSHALVANSDNISMFLDKRLSLIEDVYSSYATKAVDENLEKKNDFIDTPLVDTCFFVTAKPQTLNKWDASINELQQEVYIYSCKAKNGKYLIVKLKENWIDCIINEIKHDSSFNYIVIDDYKKIYYTTEDYYYHNDINNLFLNDSCVEKNAELKKQINIFNGDKTHFAQLCSSNKINLHFITYFRYSVITYMSVYRNIIMLEVAFILIVIMIVIIIINKSLTLSINNIVDSLKDNRYVKTNNEDDDIVVIEKSINSMQNQLDIYADRIKKTMATTDKFDNDIQVAKRLQKNILVNRDPKIKEIEEFGIATSYEAAFQLGGDFYDYFMIDNEHLMFVVADVSGKGIPASLFMIFSHTLLRSIAKPHMSVANIMEELNEKLIEDNNSDLFITVFLGCLHITTGIVSYCNAAHTSSLIIRKNGDIEDLPIVHGIPVGIYPNRQYKMSTIQLNIEDQLLLYTDGVIDSIDENGMKYTLDILKFNLNGGWFLEPDELVKKVGKSVADFRKNKAPEDDMTLLAIKYTPSIDV